MDTKQKHIHMTVIEYAVNIIDFD